MVSEFVTKEFYTLHSQYVALFMFEL